MKSKRSASVLTPRKLKKNRTHKENRHFISHDDWDKQIVPHGEVAKYECVEHEKWATVFEFLRVPFEYKPKHIGCTVDLGFDPTFMLWDREWLHCCKNKPSPITKITASMAADTTFMPVSVAQGEMFTPNYRETEFAMPLWYTVGEGCSSTRYLCDINGKTSIKFTKNILDCTTPKLCAAFKKGLSVTSLSHRPASQSHPSGMVTAHSGGDGRISE